MTESSRIASLVAALETIVRAARANADVPECHAAALEAIQRIASDALRHAKTGDEHGRQRCAPLGEDPAAPDDAPAT